MKLTELKKVVIVTETIIQNEVLKYITSLGVKGYTIYDVYGKGERGVRGTAGIAFDFFKNIKIEAITTQEIAEKIVPSVVERFFLKNYAGIAYIENVQIMRVEKFT